MGILRLVGGTEYRGAGREVFTNLTVEQAIAAAAAKSPAEMAELARKIIRQHVVGSAGMTVEQLFTEMNKAFDPAPGFEREASDRQWHLKNKLRGLGIQAAMDDPDLDVTVYGNVYDDRQLLKAIPALKPLKTVLYKLTF